MGTRRTPSRCPSTPSTTPTFDLTDSVSLYVNGANLDNVIGLTESASRAGQFQSGDAGARFYTARLGRAFHASVLYRF